MNKALTTILTVLAILVLAGFIFFAGSMYARSNLMFGWNKRAYGPGVMTGMMNRSGMVNRQNGMMNRYGSSNGNFEPLTIDQAKDAANQYLASLNNADLAISEVMIFDNNAYVVIKETSTRKGAFELLIDPASQTAFPEHGPNMMWNLKYGGNNRKSMMKGMMGGYGNMMGGWDSTSTPDLSAEMPVTPTQAIEDAQQYLAANISGATAATDPTQFYGYYTIDFEKDGKVNGMLSVNGYTGQVFLHTWHGAFIAESRID